MNDKLVIQFGKYRGSLVTEVPEQYLRWLSEQPWLSRWKELHEYVTELMKGDDGVEIMPFGKYEGTPMDEVPSPYLHYIGNQEWIKGWPKVAAYIQKHRTRIIEETADYNERDE